MTTRLTAILKGTITPMEGVALQGKKRGEEDSGAMGARRARRAGAQAWKIEAMVSLGPGRGENSPHFILHRVWQLLVTAPRTKTGKRLIRTSRTLFALLKVINHCGHGGMAPWSAICSSAECVCASACA